MKASEPTPDPGTSWPSWLLESATEVSAHLDQIDCSERKLAESTPVEFRFRHVWNRWFNEEVKTTYPDLTPSGPGQPRRPVSEKLFYAALCDNGRIVSILDQIIYTRSVGILRQIRTAKLLLNNNDMVNAMVMYRGLLELVAHFYGAVRIVEDVEAPSSWEESNELWRSIHEDLMKRAGGTRIDWQKLGSEDVETLLASKKSGSIEFTPADDRIDLTSKSIMNDLDKLTKKCPKTRKVYDVLCEFLHPNWGIGLGMTTAVEPREDEMVKAPFVEKTLSTGSPGAFVREMNQLVTLVFAQVATVLEFFLETKDLAIRAREECLKLAQNNIRHLMTKNPEFKFPYALCPCGSGAKVRFCCGKK